MLNYAMNESAGLDIAVCIDAVRADIAATGDTAL